MNSLFRIIKFAIQGFFRNFWLSVVTITMMLMAIFSVTLLLGMDYIRQATINGVEQKVDILISMKPDIDKDKVETIVNDLEGIPEVKDVRIITPEENKILFEQSNLDDKTKDALSIFDEDENPFSYSLAIQANSLDQYPAISEFIKQDKYITWVEDSTFRDYETFVEKINNVAKMVNKYSWYVIIIFSLISIIVIFNTIRISVYTRKNEITIMKLVGAGNWFVRMPFLLESVFYALSAVLIMIVIVYFTISFLQPSLNTYFQDTQAINLAGYFQDNFLFIFGLQFVVLSLLNILSTTIALRKYLEV
jgi:cell division transport system permease protein